MPIREEPIRHGRDHRARSLFLVNYISAEAIGGMRARRTYIRNGRSWREVIRVVGMYGIEKGIIKRQRRGKLEAV